MSRYQCKDCDKTFDIYSTYYSHTRRHLPPTKHCDFCQSSFYSNQDRYRHIGKFHRPSTTAMTKPVTVKSVEFQPPTRTLCAFDPEKTIKTSLVPMMFR